MKIKYSKLSLLRPSKLQALLTFGIKGYLADIGWFKAHETGAPVDGRGTPIPRITYPFIDFIKGRLTKDLSIFEFGSGNSTLFYSNYVKKVVSVEHDKEWLETIYGQKPSNSEIIFCQLIRDGDYCRMALKTNQKFHVIIIDGRDRVNCCLNSPDALTEDGVIILNDSERREYRDALLMFKERGFKQLTFSGITPGLFNLKSTSVFYRANNCLGI